MVQIESNNFFGNIFDSPTHSNTLDMMVELQSNHNDENNLNVEDLHDHQTLKEYLKSTRSRAPSCIIFPTNANNFNFKPGMIPLLPKFHGLNYENPYPTLYGI